MWPEKRTILGVDKTQPKKHGRSRIADLGGIVVLSEIKVPPPKVKNLPLVSTVAPSRSASPQRLPCIYGASRCATETPIAETPITTSFKSASPCSYISEDSYRSVPKLRFMRDAAYLAKMVDLEYWAKEVAKVDAVTSRIRAQGNHVPHVCSSALAFDVLGRLMQALPQHRHLLLPLLGHLRLVAYYEKDEGGASIIPDLCRSFGTITKIKTRRASLLGIQDESDGDEQESIEQDRQEYSDSENEDEDSDSSGIEPDGLRNEHSLKKMSLASSVVARLANVDTQAVNLRSQSSRNTFFSLERDLPHEELVQRDLIGLQIDESLPLSYQGKVPYFAIVQRQRELLSQKKDQVAWMKYIACNVSGLQDVSYRLLGVATEFTSGILHKWFFNMWKQLHQTHMALIRQMDGAKRLDKLEGFDLLRHFAAWHNHVCFEHETRIHEEIKSRKCEILLLSDTNEALNLRLENNSRLREMSDSAITFYSGCLAKNIEKRDGLSLSLKFFSPEALKVNMNRLLERFLGFVCPSADLTWIICKRVVMSKDLAFIIRSEDIEQNVEKMPCEKILVRWINYLMVVLKRQASDLLDMEAKDVVTDARSAWSVKDAPQFSARCKQIRTQSLIDNLAVDMNNGVVLTALSAMLKAMRSQASVFDPADLWPMDIKSPEERAVAIIQCLNAFAPTTKLKYFLKPSDIIQGNANALTPFLAAVFLHEAPSDDSVPLVKRKTLNVRRATAWLSHELMEKKLKTIKQQAMQSQGNEDSESDSDCSSDSEDNDRRKVEQMFLKLEANSKHLAYDRVVDLSCMLRDTEDQSDLCKMEPNELLLRWINLQVSDSETHENIDAITSFSASMKDGRTLLKIMMHVCPELAKLCDHSDLDSQSDEQCVQAVVELGSRCVPFLPLYAEDIRTGQEDLIACLVGKLFIAYPNMPPKTNARLWCHRQMLEPLAQKGYALKEGSADPRHWDTIHSFCADMKEQRRAIRNAVQEIVAMQKLVEDVHQRIADFVRKTLETRAREHMCATRIPKVTPSSRHLRSEPLRFDFMECMLEADWCKIEGLGSFDSFRDRIRQTMDPCIPALQNAFLRHSIYCRNGEYRLPCSGIMRIYGVCRMRCSCMHLPPHVAESIYEGVLQDDLPVWWSSHRNSQCNSADEPESLSLRGFFRWLFRVALQRYEMLLKESERSASDIDIIETLEQLLRRHIDPFCVKPQAEDEFLRIVCDQEVCSLLLSEGNVLKGIFLMYSTEAFAQREEEEKGITYNVMKLAEFDTLLKDSGLVQSSRANLDQKAIEHIFEQVLARGGSREDGKRACETQKIKPQFRQVLTRLRDSRQALTRSTITSQQSRRESIGQVKNHEQAALSFYEFVDALTVAAVYVSPNPLVSIGLRVAAVLQKTLMPALVDHFRKADANGSREKQRAILVQALTSRGTAAASERKP